MTELEPEAAYGRKHEGLVVPAQPLPPSHPQCLMWPGWLPRLEQGGPDVTEKHTQH